jgi:hypothetical protein
LVHVNVNVPSCLAWRTQSQIGPSNTYKNPSWYNKPFQNLKLSWSFERLRIWYQIFNWFSMLIIVMHDSLSIMSNIIVNIIMNEVDAWMFTFHPLFIHIGVGNIPNNVPWNILRYFLWVQSSIMYNYKIHITFSLFKINFGYDIAPYFYFIIFMFS